MSKRCTIIYIAGPYRDSRGDWFVRKNIQRAAEAAREVWAAGWTALCPHLNAAGFSGSDIDEEAFLEGALALLDRCDAILMVGPWQYSKGAMFEFGQAETVKLPWADYAHPCWRDHLEEALIEAGQEGG